jgi:hypothetical protein
VPARLDRLEQQAPPVSTEAPQPLLEWTEATRWLGGQPFRPSALPWLRDLYWLDVAEAYVMKASQVFISEWLVSLALWAADTRYAGRGNVLLVWPTQTQLDDFVQARVDTAITAAPGLLARVAVPRGPGKASVERVRLKQVGAGHIYFRGSDQRRQLLSIDADVLLLDELDEYKAGTLAIARQRLGSSVAPLIRGVSTPKFPSSGIGALWQTTTQRRYLLPCPGCGARQALRFPENLRPDGSLVCAHCARGMNVYAAGEWVAEQPGAAVEGFHINRLYSPRANLRELAATGYAILEGQVADQSVVQEFHNQGLGQPHAPAGGSVTDDILLACVADYTLPAPATTRPVVMGVDVGHVLHCWIKAPAPDDAPDTATRALWLGTVPSFEELDRLMTRYQVGVCVIDAEPEGHEAAKFASRFPGRVFRCFYPNMSQWRHAEPVVWQPEEGVVLAHRTRALDTTFDRFYQRLEQLPQDAVHIPGLFAHLKAPIRILTTDAAGRPVAKYEEGSAADHYAHAAAYAELARVRATQTTVVLVAPGGAWQGSQWGDGGGGYRTEPTGGGLGRGWG